MRKRSLFENVFILVFTALLFFALSMPFRDILSVFTISEVRFAAVLNPLMGICFGIPSAIGITIANFVADYLSDYSIAVLLEGIIPQFLYTFVPYVIWNRLNKGESHIRRLDSSSRLLKYALCVFVYALISGIGVGLIVQLNFGADFLNCAFFVFLNNWMMGIVLGCPLMILVNISISYNKRNLFDSEKIIIVSAFIELLLFIFIVLFVYNTTTSTEIYDIWNKAYIYSAIIINIFLVFVYIVIKIVEKNRKSKIRNIIFDMGGVLIKFDTNHFLDRFKVNNEEDRNLLKHEVFESEEWKMMDKGLLNEDEASLIIQNRVPDRLKETVKKLVCDWYKPIMPVEGAYDLIRELKDNYYNIYLLSNAGSNHKNYWPNVPGSDLFDGLVVSAYVKYVKPHKEIYSYLLDTFGLNKEDCIFIDDLNENVKTAAEYGIKSIVFDGDYDKIREQLVDNGVKVSL